MTNLTPERRAANMRLRDAATPGPWFADEGSFGNRRIADTPRISCTGDIAAHHLREEDAAYIVAACNDLPLYESALAEALSLLDRVYQEAGNAAPPKRRHALTPGLRDDIRDCLKAAGYFGGTTP